MINITIAIVFGGQTPEHHETIRATRKLYKQAIRKKLDHKYHFRYFYLSSDNEWASNEDSKLILKKQLSTRHLHYSKKRLLELTTVDVIYNTMMGSSGENGNIMGFADLLNVPIIGCGIAASAVSADKKLSKIVAESLDIPTVDSISIQRRTPIGKLIYIVEKTIGYPCFVKPTNLGTCSFVFKANNQHEFVQKWAEISYANDQSETYLVEKYLPNQEVRIFLFEDHHRKLHFNDEYMTTLKEEVLETGGGLFEHHLNKLPPKVRDQMKKYAEKLFRGFEMKDYARIDFFVATIKDTKLLLLKFTSMKLTLNPSLDNIILNFSKRMVGLSQNGFKCSLRKISNKSGIIPFFKCIAFRKS
jgi:D-alanine-D-alanine ligase